MDQYIQKDQFDLRIILVLKQETSLKIQSDRCFSYYNDSFSLFVSDSIIYTLSTVFMSLIKLTLIL